MKHTTLTKTGLILSILPILSLIASIAFMLVSETPSGVLLMVLAIFSTVPLALLYVLYLLIRFFRFPKDDPAYPGVRTVSLVALLSIFVPRLFLVLFFSNHSSIVFALVLFLTLLIPLLVWPTAEAVLHWKMRSYRFSNIENNMMN